jgi:hypothetical protein
VKRKKLLLGVLVPLLFTLLLSVTIQEIAEKPPTPKQPNVFFGVDIGYGGYEDAVKNIDAVSNFTNLVILGSLDVTTATENLTKICDYIYQKGLYFIIYVGFAQEEYLPPRGPNPEFFNQTAGRWGDKFLGVYLFDEVGGKQIDLHHPVVPKAASYTEAAEIFVATLTGDIDINFLWYEPPRPKLYLSDYALFWYDYLSGYDTVFTEFVGNQSRQLAIALCRGAAKTQNKEWGAIITWKYTQPPYLPNATELYSDMMLAYENGAKYIVIFNSPDNQTATTPHGTLTTEHLKAMQQFWNYMQQNPQKQPYTANQAYVLPKDYGFGFRNPTDKIWGLWEADPLAPDIWNQANNLTKTYNYNLDIVYEKLIDNKQANLPYTKLIYWNGTTTEP